MKFKNLESTNKTKCIAFDDLQNSFGAVKVGFLGGDGLTEAKFKSPRDLTMCGNGKIYVGRSLMETASNQGHEWMPHTIIFR